MLENDDIFLDLVANSVGPLKSGRFVLVGVQFDHGQTHWRDEMTVVVVLEVWH